MVERSWRLAAGVVRKTRLTRTNPSGGERERGSEDDDIQRAFATSLVLPLTSRQALTAAATASEAALRLRLLSGETL